MKTTIPKIKELKREWYLIDLKGVTLGKAATKIADILRGKNKATFTPHLDCGDYVVVINAQDVKLTGNKLDDKIYYSHSGFPGGLKEKTAKVMLEEKPEDVIKKAVFGMLPKNKLRKVFMAKLKVFSGEEYAHAAQQPKTIEI